MTKESIGIRQTAPLKRVQNIDFVIGNLSCYNDGDVLIWSELARLGNMLLSRRRCVCRSQKVYYSLDFYV
jgi:hypothetical protein